MSKNSIFIFFALLLLLIPGCGLTGGGSGGLGPVGEVIIPYSDRTLDVDPLEALTLSVNMREGTVLEGYLTVRGGNDDVRFYIEDSQGNRVLDINRVRDRYDFSYTATLAGFHTLYFDNSFSWFTSKLVLLHYRVR